MKFKLCPSDKFETLGILGKLVASYVLPNLLESIRLLVCNCRAGRTSEMNDVKTFKANLSTPPAEIPARIIACVAKFDEHVQRHEKPKRIFTASVINESFDSDQRAPRRQSRRRSVLPAADRTKCT